MVNLLLIATFGTALIGAGISLLRNRTEDRSLDRIYVGNDKFYPGIEHLYDNFSPHLDLMVSLLKEKIVPSLRQDVSRNYLDIGAGPGTITKALAPHFTSVVALEPFPSEEGLHTYKSSGFETITSKFSDANLEGREFDLITSTHVMYHVPIALWGEELKKMQSLLRRKGPNGEPGGVAVVTLIADRCRYTNFLQKLAGDEPFVSSAQAHRALKQLDIPYSTLIMDGDIMRVPGKYKTEFWNLLDLYALTSIYQDAAAWAAVGKEDKKRIRKEIANFGKSVYDKEAKMYELCFPSDIIVIEALPSEAVPAEAEEQPEE